MLNREDVVGWLKTIAGSANAGGGDFYIGVEDKTNKLMGFDRIAADNERNYFNNQVNEHLVPRPQMSVSFVRYGIKGSERIVTINRFHGNIISVIRYIMEFVSRRMNHTMIKLGDTRKNVDSYPQRALFEGIINTVAHRDYFETAK